MGLIFSRFRRKKTSEELLEDIQSSIEALESDREHVLQRQSYVVGQWVMYSILLYLLGAALFYFCFFPASLYDCIFYIIPLLVFPFLIFLIKNFINWYYKREIISNKDKLSDLKAKKKKILEEVMNKETYKVAREILEKYAPEQLRKQEPSLSPTPLSKLQLPKESKNPAMGPPQLQVARVTAMPQQPPVGFSPVHQKPVAPMVLQRRQPSPQRPPDAQQLSPQRRLVRPIIPRERNLIDRLIESIVGDGPSNRYALICKNCASHNGMALKEEFEYLAFRCAYCGFPNPSHKVRPVISRPPSRDPSEERKIIEKVQEKLEESGDNVKNIEEPKEESEAKETIEDKSDGGPIEAPETSEEKPPTEASIVPEGDPDEGSSTPSDGIRPRKPLHLSD